MENAAKILVIDDDPNVRKTLSDILRIKGYAVTGADNGAAGIAEAQRGVADVALIDLKLPDMSGIEVMEKIKADSPLTEAIILTGHASLDTAVEATNKGAFSYLLKPYEIDKLLRHIQRALDRQHTQREMMRLASFPQMNPSPVLEVNAAGELTYLNPAAEKVFPGLVMGHLLTGVLGEMPVALANGERTEAVRELRAGNAVFEQHFFPVPGGDRVRIYMMDITERKAHEIKLARLNTLLLTIRSINEYLLVAENEEALYRFVCKALQELEGIVGVVVCINLPDGVLKPVAWAGFGEEMMSLGMRWEDAAAGDGVIGIAAREGRQVVDNNFENSPEAWPCQQFVQQGLLKSAAAVPLISGSEVQGVLAIYSGQQNAFDEEASGFLAEVANDIAVGVHSLQLDKNLHVTLDHLRRSMNSTVEAIASMVELRDPYTAGHQRRVAQLACAIGKEMGLPERQVEGLYVIGYLHDIGKISMPAEILSKPTRLTEVEFAMIKAHSQAGYDILKNLEFPWPVAQAVLQHHERLDGSGYPQGLKGEEIILEARILMVSDVVEAMASHRPYRSAIGLKQALAEITDKRGKVYDEQVAGTCVRLFTERGFKFDSKF